MAIQFHCPGCSQPIEVDDLHAGKSAACPYCRRVITVPPASTLDDAPILARPTLDGGGLERDESTFSVGAGSPNRTNELPPPPPLHVGATATPYQLLAARYSKYAIICTVLALLFAGGAFGYSFYRLASALMAEVGDDPTSMPSQQRQSEIANQVVESLAHNSWIAAAGIGMAFLAVVGLAVSVSSLRASARGNWRAKTTLVICAAITFCTCSNVVCSIAMPGLGPPA